MKSEAKPEDTGSVLWVDELLKLTVFDRGYLTYRLKLHKTPSQQ